MSFVASVFTAIIDVIVAIVEVVVQIIEMIVQLIMILLGWDSGSTQIIEYYTLDYKSLSNELLNKQKTQVSLSPKDWSFESQQQVKKIYSQILLKKNINSEYIEKNFSLIKSQLHKGGLTLAAVLNDIFKK